MYYINLNNLEFMACHGVLDFEKTTPQKFIVDVKIETDKVFHAAESDKITDALNYAEVYEVIKNIMMNEQYDLIESIAASIGETINIQFEEIDKVDVKVTKVNPPIKNFVGTVSCEYTAMGV